MYAAIRKYIIKPNFIDEVMQRIQGEFLQIISREPGFIAYYAVRVDNDEVLTTSVFETQAGERGNSTRPCVGQHQSCRFHSRGTTDKSGLGIRQLIWTSQ